MISIHALRMERDSPLISHIRLLDDFNPRAPHGARREYTEDSADLCKISIHALRMERDLVPLAYAVFPSNFNPRAPHGARPGSVMSLAPILPFQSTRSAWSATDTIRKMQPVKLISIHALRMERDGTKLSQQCFHSNFNPRAPHGARRRGTVRTK